MLNCINLLRKRANGGNLAIKLDNKKAFDTLHWELIAKSSQGIRFSSNFMRLDWNYSSSSQLSFLFR